MLLTYGIYTTVREYLLLLPNYADSSSTVYSNDEKKGIQYTVRPGLFFSTLPVFL